MHATDTNSFRRALLDWYDQNRRTLPWRAESGQKPDPYHVWLSEVMLQQTVVKTVIPYFFKFIEKWRTVHDLANAPQEEVMDAWAGLGYYSRARNLHKCAKVISDNLLGIVPHKIDELKALPGVGDYTSAAIAAIAFDQPACVIDGNVERVMSRHFGIMTPFPDAKKQVRQVTEGLTAGRADRSGDFAQACMDLGAVVCTPKSPKCGLCPLQGGCQALDLSLTDVIPVPPQKRVKPKRFGHIFWVTDPQGYALFERRPQTVMLGGTVGLPTSAWTEKANAVEYPDFLKNLDCTPMNLSIRHSFTHFDLELQGYAVAGAAPEADGFFWQNPADMPPQSLPTVFRKFYILAKS